MWQDQTFGYGEGGGGGGGGVEGGEGKGKPAAEPIHLVDGIRPLTGGN